MTMIRDDDQDAVTRKKQGGKNGFIVKKGGRQL